MVSFFIFDGNGIVKNIRGDVFIYRNSLALSWKVEGTIGADVFCNSTAEYKRNGANIGVKELKAILRLHA